MTDSHFDNTLSSLLHELIQSGGASHILEMVNQYETENVIRTVQELMGTDVSLLNMIATLNFQEQNYDYILPYLQAAIQLSPENQDTLYSLGLFLHMINERDLALHYLKQITNPNADVLEICSKLEGAKQESTEQQLDHRAHALHYLHTKLFNDSHENTTLQINDASNEVESQIEASPLEERKQNLERVLTMIKNGKLEAAKNLASNELRKHPTDAQWWMYLGEILNAQGLKAAAWKAYDRAWLLDPQATWVDDVKKEVAAHRSAKIPKWLTDLLQVPHVTISAAMIVKNEEDSIEQTIRALKPAVDEVVVVDTGSTDRTVAIAEDLGAKVYHYEWNDDFSAARNFGLEKVTSNWVLWVDADEVLELEDIECPRIVAGLFQQESQPLVICVTILNQIGNQIDPSYNVPRLFPTQFGIKWWRRIHEQPVLPSEEGMSPVSLAFTSRIRFHHKGYQPTVMQTKNKLNRNIQLLLRSVEDNPNDLGAWAFLGRELYLNGQMDDAVQILNHTEQLAQQLKDSFPNFGRLSEIRHFLVLALENLERYDGATEVLQRLVQEDPEYPTAWYKLGIANLRTAKLLLKEAGDAFLHAHQRAPQYRGTAPYEQEIGHWKAAANLANVLQLQGDFVQATQIYETVLKVTPGNEEIQGQLDNIKKQVNELADRFR